MKIALLAGDGIGPEITNVALKILGEVTSAFGIEIETKHYLIGGSALEKVGSSLPNNTLEGCLESDAVFLGAVGSPEFDYLPPRERPEAGLLQLRKSLGGFANLRPAKAFPALINSSPLKPEIFKNTNMLIVRELLGGIYFGEPRGLDPEGHEAFNTMRYSSKEIERIARIAFETAKSRKGKVTSVDKANVLETSRLWRETVDSVAQEYEGIELEHLFVDACAMHLVTNPSQFDVILTENLFGDILSDEAAVLTGSLGMLPSATIGGTSDLYEPVHGSAPDIAGLNVANPIGGISCVAMMLRNIAKHEEAAAAIENAIDRVLNDGYRTLDLVHENDSETLSTSEMGDLISEYAIENVNVRYAFHAV